MTLGTGTSTYNSTSVKLERLAAHLLTQYGQPIKQQLGRNPSADTVRAVKELLWKHLERDLSNKYPEAPNLHAVLTDTKKKLIAAINAAVEVQGRNSSNK